MKKTYGKAIGVFVLACGIGLLAAIIGDADTQHQHGGVVFTLVLIATFIFVMGIPFALDHSQFDR